MLDRFKGDKRLDPAAAGLTGKPRETLAVETAVAPLKDAPEPFGPLASTLLHREVFDVYETADGWCRGRAHESGYIGYVPAATLGPMPDAPSHVVTLPMTHTYGVPTIKAEPVGMLFLNSCVRVTGEEGAFLQLAGGLYIEHTHLAPIGEVATDFVAVAEMVRHAPYLWGGNTVQGLDCSGLVQMAMLRAGQVVLRDADMQEATIGAAVDADGPLMRGDLVFWRGHVGIMTGPETIIHATEYTLRVVEEDFPTMRARLTKIGLDVTSVKRP